MRFRWLGLPLIGSLAAIAAYGLWHRGSEGAGDTFIAESVDRGPITATVSATGTVNPVTTVQVGTYVSGPIKEIDVDFNSLVKKGQRIAKIDPAPFIVRVRRAEANLANARAQVEKGRADLALKRLSLERSLELRARELISQQDLDAAKSAHEQAVAQAALDAASVKQAEAEVVSPNALLHTPLFEIGS